MVDESLLTPRDWEYIAIQEAIKLVGTDEYRAKMVEARRYAALAEYIDTLKAQLARRHVVGFYTPSGTLAKCDDPNAARRYGWEPVFIEVDPKRVTPHDQAETEPSPLQA